MTPTILAALNAPSMRRLKTTGGLCAVTAMLTLTLLQAARPTLIVSPNVAQASMEK
jgi:hypothetical protein